MSVPAMSAPTSGIAITIDDNEHEHVYVPESEHESVPEYDPEYESEPEPEHDEYKYPEIPENETPQNINARRLNNTQILYMLGLIDPDGYTPEQERKMSEMKLAYDKKNCIGDDANELDCCCGWPCEKKQMYYNSVVRACRYCFTGHCPRSFSFVDESTLLSVCERNVADSWRHLQYNVEASRYADFNNFTFTTTSLLAAATHQNDRCVLDCLITASKNKLPMRPSEIWSRCWINPKSLVYLMMYVCLPDVRVIHHYYTAGMIDTLLLIRNHFPTSNLTPADVETLKYLNYVLLDMIQPVMIKTTKLPVALIREILNMSHNLPVLRKPNYSDEVSSHLSLTHSVSDDLFLDDAHAQHHAYHHESTCLYKKLKHAKRVQ
jgi:hypothetical protein